MPILPAIPRDRPAVVEWVREHLGHLAGDADGFRVSPIRGTQEAADAALARLDIEGYASRRSQVLPRASRGATQLSPYIRHGLLSLPTVWDAVRDAPPRDRQRFRDELLWQEYSRHVYARVGAALREPLRFGGPVPQAVWEREAWPAEMACMAATTEELLEDGWVVNQARMWLASQWAVRAGLDWRVGERAMFRQLLDGSYANTLGWQWSIGSGTGKVYGFSRWQVEKRAPALCQACRLSNACPIQEWPSAVSGPRIDTSALRFGTTEPGPLTPVVTGEPEAVWLTGESLGTDDPAARAYPAAPRVFVFDEPLLRELELSAKRLVFLAEAVSSHDAEVRLGEVATELGTRPLAVTWTFVPGFARRSKNLNIAALHPWPWLRRPGRGSVQSFSSWNRG